MENEQKIYEIGYLLSPLISEENLDEEVGFFRKLIEDKKGLIITENRPKIRRLAYPIAKTESAYFGWIKFMVEPEYLVEIESPLKKRVIRFQTAKINKETAAITPTKRVVKKRKVVSAEIKQGVRIEEMDKKLDELLANQ